MKWDVAGLKENFPKKEDELIRLQVKAGLLALLIIDKERDEHLQKADGQQFQSQILSDQTKRGEYLPDLQNLANYLASVIQSPGDDIVTELCGPDSGDGSQSPFEWVKMSLERLETESGENLFDFNSHGTNTAWTTGKPLPRSD